MPCNDDGDKPFNPFYIGPHPSKACATADPETQKCSPCTQSGGQQKQVTGAAATATVATTAAAAGVSTVGTGPASTSASVAVGASDDPACQLGKQGNADDSGNTGNAGADRRPDESQTHDDQRNGHGAAAAPGSGGAAIGVGVGASLAGSSNVAGGLLIVGMAGPTGGIATIYSTGQIPTGSMATNALPPTIDPSPITQSAQAKQTVEQAQQQDESKPCRTYPCMERSGRRDGAD